VKHFARVSVMGTLLASCAGIASAGTDARDIEASLTGCWTGVLQYRDYQSDRTFDIPLRTRIVAVPDRLSFVRTSVFDDGPARKVHITTLTQFSPTGDRATYASSRAGQPMELTSDQVEVRSFEDSAHWTEVYSRVDLDGEKKSDIVVEVVRDGETLTSEKRVRNLDDPSKTFRVRNRTVLKRLATCPE
jgi:hypothetical protein